MLSQNLGQALREDRWMTVKQSSMSTIKKMQINYSEYYTKAING